MKVSSVSVVNHNYHPVAKINNKQRLSETGNPQTTKKPLNQPVFKGVFTKILGGIGVVTATMAIIGTGGAATVLLPALGYAGTCTGIGYLMDKDNENDNKNK